jgi:hypothetical protein
MNAQTAPPQTKGANLGSFSIVIVPGATLSGNAAALAAFNRAAQAWAARISDPITITINADLASLPAGVIGSTSSVILEAPYNTIRNQMVADAANEADDGIAGSLPTAAQFTATLPAGAALTGNVSGSKANLKAMGFTGLDGSFGVSDGTITFSTNFNFDFDNSNGVTAGQEDFETVAAHEIGHLLGFFSGVDDLDQGSTEAQPNTLDLFRFRNDVAGQDPATAAEFTTFPRDMVPGADDITDEASASPSFPERRMSTGKALGDNNQASHWKADDLTGIFIGLMDPTLAFGQFYGPQFSDFRALDLIGYEIVSNLPPTVSVAGSTLSYAENDPATLLDAAATVTDGDSADFNGGNLTVDFSANGAAEDRLEIRNEGAGAGQIGVSGSNVTFGGTNIGVFTGGTSGSSPLVVTFTSLLVTPAVAQSLLRNITYRDVSDNPSTLLRTVRFAVNDGDGGTSAPVTRNLQVNAANDAPQATNLSAAETYTEDTALNLIDIVVSDPDSANVTATLTLSNPAAGVLSTATSGAVTSTYVAGTGVWTAAGAIANVNALLAGVVFTPATEFSGNFTITTNVGDGAAATGGSKAMTGTAVNDTPQATNLSAGETYTEDTALNLIDIVTSDVDSASVTATLTLSTQAAGALSTGTSGAVTSTFNSGVWTAAGAIANVNALLAGVIFTPATNFNANFTINTSVSDGATAATGSKGMTGTPVNDAPTATNLSAAETYTEDTALNLIDIVISDVDSANATATLTLSNSAAGSLSTATSGAVTSTFSLGVWSASGAIADVNTLLAGVTFTPAANFNTSFTITTSVSDGIASAIIGSKTMTGVAVNDAPQATNLSAAETYTEDTALNLIDIVVTDVDTATVTATLTLSNLSAGTLNTGTSGAVTSTFNSGVWTASGAIANVNTLLAGVVFTPATNFNAAFTITTSVSDGVAAAVTGSKAMTGIAVNDAPTATNLSAAETYTEDTALNLINIVTGDVDSANITATLTLSNPSAGSLSTATSGAVTATFSAGVWTASGAIADVNTLLAGAIFTPAANFNASFSITTSVSDGVATALTGSKTMTGIPVNDPPTATNLSSAESYTEDTPLNLIEIVASDVDGGNVTATLTLSNPAAGSLSMGTSGAVTATFAGGVWTASGPIANVNALLASVTLNPAVDFNANFTITTSVSDGVATPVTGSKIMTGIPVNDPPTATNLAAAESYTEDTPLNLIDIVAGDIDSSSVTVTLTLSNPAAGDLSTGTSGAVTSTFASGVWSAAGAIANVNALLATVTFTPAENFNGDFTIATSVSDGVAAAVTGNKVMTGIPVNDPPTATNLSATEIYTEDTPLPLTDIVAADIDSASVIATLTLSNPGTGSLSTGTFGAVTSTFAAGVWTAAGPIADVNALLAGVAFNPAADFNANFTIVTSVSDGVAAAVTGSKAMTGIAVNDPPTSLAPLTISTAEDTPQAFIAGDVVRVSDVDGSGLEVTLAATNGTLSLSTLTGLAFTTGDGSGDATMKFSGSQTELNAALATLNFAPRADYNGPAALTFTTSDGEAPAVVKTVALTLTAVADIVSDSVTTDEDTALAFDPIAGTHGASADNFEGAPVLTAVTQGASGSVMFDAGGSITYQPSADFNGADVFTYTVTSGGVTETASISVMVAAVNDAPVVNATPGTISYLENQSAIAIDGALSAADVDSPNFVGATVAITGNFASGEDVLSYSAPGPITGIYSAATGVLALSGDASPAAYQAALRSVTYFNSSNHPSAALRTITFVIDDGSATDHLGSATRTLAVTPVNDVPTLTAISDPAAISEDAAEQTVNLAGISAGGGETQTLLVTATSDHPEIVPNPTVTYTSPNGTGSLAYTPVANANGDATITVTVKDDGGTANNGIDVITRTFTVHVTPVNDAPSFTKGANVTVLEDAGPQTITGWASAMSAGPANENTQALNFIVAADQPTLFATQPAIATNGTLTFAWAANSSGTASITVSLHDDGGVANSGVDTSPAQTFTISTTAVNDAPSFVIGPAIDTAQDAGMQTFQGWATAISAGPNETQTVHFIVQVDKPGLFATAPTITPTGTLSYAPAPSGSGVAIMTVRLQDDGGTTNNGADTSAAQTVEIAVTSFLEELGSYTGIVQPAASGPRENARTGSVKWKVAAGGKFTGKVSLPGKSAAFKGAIGQDGVARFGKLLTPTFTINRKGLSALDLALKVEVARGTNTFGGTLRDGATDFAVLAGDRGLYTSKRNPVPPLEPVPSALLGNYTVILPALTPLEQNQLAIAFPQGDGFGRLVVSKTGVGKLTATLADGTKISSAAPLAKSGRWPIYRPFGKTGSIGGFAKFEDVLDLSDVAASNLLWFKAPNLKSPRYSNGWTGGISVKLAGAKYTAPTRKAPGPVLPALSTADGDGNARLTLSDGGAGFNPQLFALSIDPTNRPSFITNTDPKSTFALSAATGMFKGKFPHPLTGKATVYNGAVLQKQKLGSGFFLGPAESGAATLEPNANPTGP